MVGMHRLLHNVPEFLFSFWRIFFNNQPDVEHLGGQCRYNLTPWCSTFSECGVGGLWPGHFGTSPSSLLLYLENIEQIFCLKPLGLEPCKGRFVRLTVSISFSIICKHFTCHCGGGGSGGAGDGSRGGDSGDSCAVTRGLDPRLRN